MPRFSANISMLFAERGRLDRPAAAAAAGFGAIEIQLPHDRPVEDWRRAIEAAGLAVSVVNPGSQFTGFAFTGRLQAAGIRISMDGRGRCMDNIFIERLWRSLKYEAVYLHEIADGFTARRVIGEWIGFYNTQRPHSALGGRTPAEACRGGPPVGMWTSRFAPCPHPHRRNSSNRKIDSRGFWRPELQPEYTLAKPPSCPKRRGHLNDHTCRMDWRREPPRRLAIVDTIDLRNLATDCGPEPARLMGGHARRLQSPPSRRRCLCGLAPGTGSALRW